MTLSHLAPRTPKKLNVICLVHLNNVHQNIQFTMEMERNDHLSFLSTDIYKRHDDSLGHKVY
jgi:hypothetical protein